MTFGELVNKRRSVRSYSDTPVEREKLQECVEAARLAPSACNSQPWHFVVADEPDLVRKIAPLTTTAGIPINAFVQQAPVIVALITERPNLSSSLGALVKGTPFHLLDVGIAAEHFCLRAAELGLGTCMLGWFNKKALKKLLEIPSKKEVPLLIAIGYPSSEEVPQKKRKPLDEIMDFGKYRT
ncbi:MAG: NAD(P)H nitroreductase [Spirochaetales bacterium]|nr:NAD(P)H nitroreductase [Spirochaetales bacterium]